MILIQKLTIKIINMRNNMKKQNNRKANILRNAKESPQARRARVSGGARFRAAVFADRRRKLHERISEREEKDYKS